MIFGISVSDIYGCARLAYRLYDEFKQAPGACQAFARDLLLFYNVLMETKSTIESEVGHLNDADTAALSVCLDSCKDLLYVQIMGIQKVPEDLEEVGLNKDDPQSGFLKYPFYGGTAHGFHNWSQRFEKRKLASRIPKFQSAISAHIEKLSALLILFNRQKNQEFQHHIEKRVEESHDHFDESLADHRLLFDSMSDRLDKSHELLAEFSTDHALQLDSVSERLDTSQARIESQLQAILANQQKSKTPILSQTLDASSPEGRQTWMELGRLLRDEGITPAVIQNNRGLLIDAMKNTLRSKTLLAESASESYATAPEYQVGNHNTSVSQPKNVSYLDLSTFSYPTSLLGSAPPRSAGFSTSFLERQHGSANSLDQKQNVDDGMQSLLQGMSHDNLTPDFEPAKSENVRSEELSFKRVPININNPPSRSSRKQKPPARISDLLARSIPIEDPSL